METRSDAAPDRLSDFLVGVAVTLVVVIPLPFLSVASSRSTGDTEWIAWLVLAVACLAIFFRRRFPLTVTLVTMGCTGIYYPLSSLDGMIIATLVVSLYTLAAVGRPIAAGILSAVAYSAIAISQVTRDFVNLAPESLILMSGWFIAVVAIGGLVNHYRNYREQSQAALASEAKRQVAEERIRIARDLHDSVGHHVSLIRVQASAALRKARKDSAFSAAEPLEIISDTSAQALQELRSTVKIMRAVDAEAPLQPIPDMGQLESLVDSVRETGLQVSLATDIERPIPRDVELAVYRIVQEALTNVTRHSGASSAWVSVALGPTSLVVLVEDNGRGGRVSTDGSGMAGMRERTEALGGSFVARSRDDEAPGETSGDSGFMVRAILPVED